MNVLALCGSLRQQSRSLALLQAMRALAPGRMEVTLFAGLGELPLFNPDLEPCAPKPVQALWNAVAQADALVIASPEYAHGVTGTIKNALDWLVSFEGFINKPVVLINARPAEFAAASLRETLSVMNARLLDAASVTLPLTSNTPDSAALLGHVAVRERLQAALQATRDALR